MAGPGEDSEGIEEDIQAHVSSWLSARFDAKTLDDAIRAKRAVRTPCSFVLCSFPRRPELHIVACFPCSFGMCLFPHGPELHIVACFSCSFVMCLFPHGPALHIVASFLVAVCTSCYLLLCFLLSRLCSHIVACFGGRMYTFLARFFVAVRTNWSLLDRQPAFVAACPRCTFALCLILHWLEQHVATWFWSSTL
jgi:hypothetical protein